jgi:hypothetical protein
LTRRRGAALGSFQFGQIVVVEKMLDPNDVNPKDRPAVIISRPDEIDRDGFLFVIASLGQESLQNRSTWR